MSRATIASGLTVSYDLDGNDDHPAVTLIHPVGLDREIWGDLLKRLVRRFRVLTYDVRGHGGTDRPAGPYTIRQMADDLNGLLWVLGIRETHIIGLSMGGMIAQEFALAHGGCLRSLVLAATTGSTSALASAIEERARLAEEQGMGALLDSTLERWFTSDFLVARPPVIEDVRSTLLANDARAHAAAWRAIARHDALSRLSAVLAPTLLLCGDADASTPVAVHRLIQERIAGSRLGVVTGGPHMLPLEKPEEFAAEVMQFLGGVERRG